MPNLVCTYTAGIVVAGLFLIFEIAYVYKFYPPTYWRSSEKYSVPDLWLAQSSHQTEESVAKLKDNTCKIPILDPYEPSMMSYFLPHAIDCSRYSTFYFTSHMSEDYPGILMTKPLPDNMTCCFEILRFTDKAKFEYRPLNLRTDRCFFISQNATAVPSDSAYIIINCWKNWRKSRVEPIYTGALERMPDHREILFYSPKPTQDLLKKLKNKKDHEKGASVPLNMIILGFDQISRLNFIRQMGKTFNYLKNNLEAIDLQGYNKVGDATLNNTAAFLTGFDSSGLSEICWKNKKGTFDSCPWIWKKFSEKGYITAYADDYTSVFDYRFRGFQVQPTDIYLHPFIKWYHNWKQKRWLKFGTNDCIGNEKAADLLHDHVKKVAKTLIGHPYFQFVWHSRVHERPGYPSVIDTSTLKTLQHLEEMGILNKSMVVMLSDHGWRAGDVMLHQQARLENRMPFAFIILPEWFRRKYPTAYNNLGENQYRLTTPYDIYSTMLDVLNPESQLQDANIKERIISSEETRGKKVSLFLPVPHDRSCEMAHVDEMWCICRTYKYFPVNSSVATALGTFAVKTINSWLKPFKGCYQYKLERIISAEVGEHDGVNSNEIDLHTNNTFRISFSASPKGAQFEVIIFSGGLSIKGSIIARMSTEVFRLNRYLKSDCMKEYSLKKICTCKE